MEIRPATGADDDAIWRVLEPAFRAGETYMIERDISRDAALAYWKSPGHAVFVADDGGAVVGTYYLRANQRGPGMHVCNSGYITAPQAQGRGVARAMCTHSLDEAKKRGFKAMQFNAVISTNQRAIRLWQQMGFDIVGMLPGAFNHPRDGMVDALVMFRRL
ncbi:MAG: GNAT family N-acetyltransferase [Pseudolabrys sp.]|nr:GNAT family N-acetyltransferase [Pseudolabrys sp.]MBV9954242.1 GNAT family N-acetyltransferase [Pseudolabrys sp.]